MMISFFHPTRVLFLDDEYDFLEMLRKGSSGDTYLSEYYTSPSEVISILNNKKIGWYNKYINRAEEKEFEHKLIDININDIHKEIYDSKRFNEISTIVVDYDMGETNGLEFCKSIKDPHIEKILLTARADDKTIIDAFNKGIINRYIDKGDHSLTETVHEQVVEAQYRYFEKITKPFTDSVMTSHTGNNIFQEERFKPLFNEILKKHNIIEYYLFESTGSFILLDQLGNTYGLFCLSQNQVNEIYNEVEDSTYFSAGEKKVISQGGKIFCYHNASDPAYPELAKWKPFIRDANHFNGDKEKFYFALIKEEGVLDINKKKVKSYKSFRFNEEF